MLARRGSDGQDGPRAPQYSYDGTTAFRNAASRDSLAEFVVELRALIATVDRVSTCRTSSISCCKTTDRSCGDVLEDVVHDVRVHNEDNELRI